MQPLFALQSWTTHLTHLFIFHYLHGWMRVGVQMNEWPPSSQKSFTTITTVDKEPWKYSMQTVTKTKAFWTTIVLFPNVNPWLISPTNANVFIRSWVMKLIWLSRIPWQSHSSWKISENANCRRTEKYIPCRMKASLWYTLLTWQLLYIMIILISQNIFIYVQ